MKRKPNGCDFWFLSFSRCKDHLQLCQLTGAGMGCGSCRPEVKAILDSFVNVLKAVPEGALAE
ncbi:MAG: (2Fe-2S)-binding protein [Proteobacteria bacterium]|nr:MAG: (2Fe-2S)-binding protein [Pseudomonadota bacterium]